jgi:uncharacterized membrane protein
MYFGDLNYVVPFIAAIVSMGLGFLWYSPFVFGKPFMKESGMTQESMDEYMRNGGKEKMVKTYALTFISSVLSAIIISGLLYSLVIVGIWGYVFIAFSLWLAFSFPVGLNHVLFGKDSVTYLAITSGYQFVSIVFSTLIIGIFG